MVGHDPQRTNRSPETGPVYPHLLRTIKRALSNPVVGPDGTIYAWARRALVAVDASDRRLWRYRASQGFGGPPVLAPNGSVGVVALPVNVVDPKRSSILIITHDGRLTKQTEGVGFSKNAAPLVDGIGDIYFPIAGPDLVRGNPYGELVVTSTGSGAQKLLLQQHSVDAIAEAHDGTLYALVRDYKNGGGGELVALDTAGRELWTRLESNSTLLLGRQGTVYTAGGTTIVAYTPTGRRIWRRVESRGALALAERADGTVLVAGSRWLDAFTPKGKRVWRAQVGRSSYYQSPALAVDSNGTAYAATGDGRLDVIARNGRRLDSLSIGPSTQYGSLAIEIGPDGKLILTDTNGYLRVYGS